MGADGALRVDVKKQNHGNHTQDLNIFNRYLWLQNDSCKNVAFDLSEVGVY